MHTDTLAITAGKDYQNNSGTVTTPIHRTSTILFPTLKSYHDAESKGKDYYQIGNGEHADYSYGISGTPTNFALQKTLNQLEGQGHTLLTSSGLSAITTVLLSLVRANDHILVADTVYGPTRRFCNKELKRYGVETTFYDPLIGADISQLIQENTKLIFLESPGSLTFEIQDIPAIVQVAKKQNIPTIIDNSWATPIYFKALDHGIDISIQAGTKYIGGHSDLFLGIITSNEEYIDTIYKTYKHLGQHVTADICHMAIRGIRTLPTRLKAHEQSALKVAKWLSKQRTVSTVLHPAFSSCPGHKLWKRDFTGSTGLFSIILNKQYSFDALSNMINNLEFFGIGASWGGFESLILNFDPTLIRTASTWQRSESCIRIYTGLESPDDLIKDLEQGLKRLN